MAAAPPLPAAQKRASTVDCRRLHRRVPLRSRGARVLHRIVRDSAIAGAASPQSSRVSRAAAPAPAGHAGRIGGRPERRQRCAQVAAVACGRHPGVQDRDHAAVIGAAQQPARTLGQQQRGMAGGDGHETVAAAGGDGALPRGQQRVIGPRKRDAVDQHQRQRRARVRRRPATATACRTARSPRRRRTVRSASTVVSSPWHSTGVSSRSRIASAAARAARIDENRPSVRPPAAVISSAISVSCSAEPVPSRPGGGSCAAM